MMTTKVVVNDYIFNVENVILEALLGGNCMSDLKKNIDRYMDIKQIKYYSDLLLLIGKELGVNNPYDFADKEKSNFSKMLKGERPLKHEFIIPLEKIFGVSMARLLNDNAYALPLDKEDMPYIKSNRYYAYKDDMALFEDEFEKTMISTDGYPTVCNSDEFNKTFLDYVVEYRSVNALRFLLRKHNLKPTPFNRNSFTIDNSFSIFASSGNDLLKMVIQEDDVELFRSLFDPFETCIRFHVSYDQLRLDLQTFEFILNSEKIFNYLFEPKQLKYKDFNSSVVGHDDEIIVLLNPLLSECLDYALSDLSKYSNRARQILLFGIDYNKKALESIDVDSRYLRVEEYGCVYCSGYELVTSIVYPEYSTDDKEMVELIDKLSLPRHTKRA